MLIGEHALGSLYIVSTPIGNLKDITYRAIEILKIVSIIAAEDTRTTIKLLNSYGIKTKLTSFTEHNHRTKIPIILEILKTNDVALVSEAGVPLISDPGFELVEAVADSDIPVIPVPGPSALTAALSVSDIRSNHFLFLGFPPKQGGARQRFLKLFRNSPASIVIFESPHRLRETLKEMISTWGDRYTTICRELTKIHEEIFRGTLSEALSAFSNPRGEFTLVVKPKGSKDTKVDQAWLNRRLKILKELGASSRDAIAILAEIPSVSRREIYNGWLKIDK